MGVSEGKRARQMFEGDALMRSFGAVLESADGDRARISLVVGEGMVQGHGTCHGGVIFALADAAFGVACNGGSDTAVAQHCTVTYLRPARRGERLTSEVSRRSGAGRSGVYDGTVTASDGTVVAEFRGVARRLPDRGI
ncbi:hydroxyphenylacetyl-CoA thioesterase PaaI [Chelatococcus daeguensis]|nr:hypothetical protein AVW15_16780 [Chelatococcus daeguensis]MBM3083072.1 hydroxyphenylacetyl-CoA thioesterase PaaI [Chelatococcus daeguensis]